MSDDKSKEAAPAPSTSTDQQQDQTRKNADANGSEGSQVPRKKKRVEEPRPDPIPGRCQFFVERKRRYCKAPPAKEKIYCTEHSHELKVTRITIHV